MADRAESSGTKMTHFSKGQPKNLRRVMEMDARESFLSPSGVFFHERITKAGLTPRLGNPHWFYTREKVERVRQRLFYDIKKGVILKLQLQGGRTHTINREYVSRMTGLTMNPNYSRDTMDKYSAAMLITYRGDPTQLVLDIAPYADPQAHYVLKVGFIKTVALQENRLLVAKWYTTNFLGLEARHYVNGKCAWFLKHLSDGDLLTFSWCPCDVILRALQHLENRPKDGWNLPCLVSPMYNDLTGITTTESDNPVTSPLHKFIFFGCDISGFRHGALVVGETAPRSFEWYTFHGPGNLGGGFQYAIQKLELPGVTPSNSEMAKPDDSTAARGADVTETHSRACRHTAMGSRRSRTENNMADGAPPSRGEGSKTFILNVFTAPPGGVTSFPDLTTVALIPTAGYIYLEYIRQVPVERSHEAVLHMQSMYLQIMNNLDRHFQTGFRFPPSPPSSSSESSEKEGLSSGDGSSSGDDD